jgi:PAS domain S-box-containing protein
MESIRILIIDDNRFDRRLLRHELEGLSFPIIVSEATDVDSGLESVAHYTPDAVLCDYFLSQGVTALDFMVQLNERGLDIPTVIITGHSDYDIISRTIGMGAFDYLNKIDRNPENLYRIIVQINRFVQQKRQVTESNVRQRLLEEAVNQGPAIVLITDTDGLITYVNPKFTEISGWSEAEAIGRKPGFLHGTEPTQHAEFWNTIREGKQWAGEFHNHRKDGSIFWVSAQVSPIRNPEGIITHYVAVEEDISRIRLAHDALQESENRFRTLIDASFEGVAIHERAMIVDANQAFADTFGYPLDEIIGLDGGVLLAPESLAVVRANTQNEFKAPYDCVGIRRNGQRIHIELIGRTVIHHGKRMRMTAVRDITARKANEAALKRAKDEAEQANQSKNEFLAKISHELRTPLHAIIGFSDVLIDEIDGPLNDTQKESLQRIRNAGSNLVQLITDLLDISKIEAGKMDFQFSFIRIHETIDYCLGLIRPMAEEKKLALHHEIANPDLMVYADEAKVKQVLLNLLGNAVKFTDTGAISVRITESPKKANILIRDTGIGMTPGEIARIFDDFAQANNNITRKYGGTGLGLAISRRLVELQGGWLSAESEKGIGSEFSLSLSTEALTAAVTHRSQSEKPEHYVLVIDDDVEITEVIEKMLKIEHFGVYTVNNPLKAVPAVVELKPDVILLDIMMQFKDGFQVLKDLRANPETSNIPVVVISMFDNRSLSAELGAVDSLVKPFSRFQLYDKIRAALQRAEHTAE